MRAVAQRCLGHDGEAIGGAAGADRACRLEGLADAIGPGGIGPLRDLEADLDVLARILTAGADLLGQRGECSGKEYATDAARMSLRNRLIGFVNSQ